MSSTDSNIIFSYHESTKHHFDRYARSAGFMDWANQPNPFRFYDGAQQIPLPLTKKDPERRYDALFHWPDDDHAPLNLETAGTFLELSLGLSAWKMAGTSRWSLRINPSSGNLHPTEGHLILPDCPGLEGGVFHYAPFRHELERRLLLPQDCWPPLVQHFRGPGFLVALTSIYWRESWKYGERAYRYCNLDAGHALAALSFSARLQGWQAIGLTGAGDDQIKMMLGLTGLDWPTGGAEEPDLICWVTTAPSGEDIPRHLPDDWEQFFADLPFTGQPNRLSPRVKPWPIIGATSAAGNKPITRSLDWADHSSGTKQFRPDPVVETAATIFRRRRSAVRYNPSQSIPASLFFSVLHRTLAQWGAPPFNIGLSAPDVNLVLFVHRVDGLDAGLYFLGREEDSQARCQHEWRDDFLWSPAHDTLPLWLLKAMDVTYDAMELSCHQEIAGDSAFALAMIARFQDRIQSSAYTYRRLYWECGMIGQVLYLEAEARGLRGTGIGCFFDDPVHHLLGMQNQTYQCLYHFTVGHPIEDTRLTTLPGYHHLNR